MSQIIRNALKSLSTYLSVYLFHGWLSLHLCQSITHILRHLAPSLNWTIPHTKKPETDMLTLDCQISGHVKSPIPTERAAIKAFLNHIKLSLLTCELKTNSSSVLLALLLASSEVNKEQKMMGRLPRKFILMKFSKQVHIWVSSVSVHFCLCLSF